MNWISVNERLPELHPSRFNILSSDPVLMTDGKNIEVGVRWKSDSGAEHFLPNYREEFEKVTHWMPLPEPPSDKER